MKRVFIGLLILVMSLANCVSAAEYRVLVVPDSLANKPCIDAFIYEESAEFFANQVINKLNKSGTVETITVSEAREKLQKNPRLNIATRESLLRFKKEYNIDYMNLKKLALMFNTNKILLLTTSADAQNYFTRRTFWDFLNIPGASVIDPAIKLSTYAVLVDTDKSINLWEDTFYKTISSCESRMVANSLEPQTIQLEKIRDYSKLLAPQIASNVQVTIVPASKLNKNNKIEYCYKNIENVFTKKVKTYHHDAKIIQNDTNEKIENYKKQIEKRKEVREQKRILLEEQNKRELQELEEQKAKELKDVNELKVQPVEVKEVTIEQQNKKQEPKVKTKVLNISKEEYVDSQEKTEIKEEKIEPPKLRYYLPHGHIVNPEKNKTINDI